DALGARWKQDGEFLLCRSTSYFWDKLKEVPNRDLARWQRDSQREGGLPFSDLLEMASLSDPQLDSTRVRQGIRHCWELPEWGLVSRPLIGGMEYMRPYARILAPFPEDQWRGLLEADGIPFSQLPLKQQQELLPLVNRRIVGPPGEIYPQLLSTRIRVDYAPAGSYAWQPMVDRE